MICIQGEKLPTKTVRYARDRQLHDGPARCRFILNRPSIVVFFFCFRTGGSLPELVSDSHVLAALRDLESSPGFDRLRRYKVVFEFGLCFSSLKCVLMMMICSLDTLNYFCDLFSAALLNRPLFSLPRLTVFMKAQTVRFGTLKFSCLWLFIMDSIFLQNNTSTTEVMELSKLEKYGIKLRDQYYLQEHKVYRYVVLYIF
jgi:hypothetical protein